MSEEQAWFSLSFEQLQPTSSHNAEGRKCALEWLARQQLLSFTKAPEEEMSRLGAGLYNGSSLLSLHRKLWDVSHQLLWRFRHDPDDQVAFKWCFFCYWLVIFIYTPGPCVPPPPGPPVCKSLISALVAVQMALCWCFTIGLRSVCLMPSAHSTSTRQLSHSYHLVFFVKKIPQHASGLHMFSRWYGSFVLGGSFKNHRWSMEADWKCVNVEAFLILFRFLNHRIFSSLFLITLAKCASHRWPLQHPLSPPIKPDVRISDQPKKWKCKSTICSVIPKQALVIIQELV